jgi:hypothetical protein
MLPYLRIRPGAALVTSGNLLPQKAERSMLTGTVVLPRKIKTRYLDAPSAG